MSAEQIKEIELNIEEAREAVARGDALDRLHSNKDFQTLITEGYFREECVRLVHLKGAPAFQAEAQQEALIKAIDAIGGFYQYLGATERAGDAAREAIEDGNAALAEIAQEDDE